MSAAADAAQEAEALCLDVADLRRLIALVDGGLLSNADLDRIAQALAASDWRRLGASEVRRTIAANDGAVLGFDALARVTRSVLDAAAR